MPSFISNFIEKLSSLHVARFDFPCRENIDIGDSHLFISYLMGRSDRAKEGTGTSPRRFASLREVSPRFVMGIIRGQEPFWK